jgi:cytochrome c biogenesis protein
MATTQAPRIVSRRRAAAKAAPVRRTRRYERYLKHPINSLWGLFSSVKTAVVLIALITVICIIGIIVIQAPVEITSSPSDFALWVQQDMVGKYGQEWTNIFNSLGFFTIFSSWYFRTLMVLLAINVAVCTMNRAPGIWHNFRNPAVRTNDRFYQNALARQEFETRQDVDGVRRFFRKKHYRVMVKEGSSGNGVTYLYAYKNTWATLSTFVFHACLVSLMLATVITNWHGFGTNSMAQHILPKPIYTYLQNLAGFSYTQPLPDGESGIVYPIGTANNIVYRADQFVAKFDPTSGQPTDFYTDLTLFQDGKQVAQHRIRVNDPLTYQGVTFHQASFIMYAWITITDARGNVIFNQKPILNEHLNNINPNTGNSVPVNVAQNIPLPNIQQVMNVAATQTPDGWAVIVNGTTLKGKPSFCGFAGAGSSSPVIDLSQGNLSCSQALGAFNLGQQDIKLNGWTLDVKLVKLGTVLLITKDSGSPLIWPISALLVLSLCVTFYFPQRRVWIRFRDGHVQFAGLKEHFINVQRDFNLLAAELLALDAKTRGSPSRERLKDPPAARTDARLKISQPGKSGERTAAAIAKADEAEETEASGTEAAEAMNTAEETSATSSPECESAGEKKEVTAGN